ncbi:unnamed protein product [Durusdinium trenchii]|uniref:Uncharacterized protein n=1 Tax=Durusdinium trenchii TaxID=1381693 RepID=A0ABP0NLL6_9DINO
MSRSASLDRNGCDSSDRTSASVATPVFEPSKYPDGECNSGQLTHPDSSCVRRACRLRKHTRQKIKQRVLRLLGQRSAQAREELQAQAVRSSYARHLVDRHERRVVAPPAAEIDKKKVLAEIKAAGVVAYIQRVVEGAEPPAAAGGAPLPPPAAPERLMFWL